MLQLEKFYTVLKLGVFVSFFMSNVSWFLWYWGVIVVELMRGTFLDSFGFLIDVIFNILAPFLTYAIWIFFVLSLITLFIVFLIDVMGSGVNKNNI